MKRPLILDISITLLLARLKQSIVAAAGVTFGIAMFIIDLIYPLLDPRITYEGK